MIIFQHYINIEHEIPRKPFTISVKIYKEKTGKDILARPYEVKDLNDLFLVNTKPNVQGVALRAEKNLNLLDDLGVVKEEEKSIK